MASTAKPTATNNGLTMPVMCYQLPFRVELWDRNDQHIRWVIAASPSIAIGHAALDAAIASYPDQRFTLRNGILVIREHVPSRTP